VKALLFELLDLPAADRLSRALEATSGRPTLRREALELLERAEKLDAFMEGGARVPEPCGASPAQSQLPLPEMIGGLRIVRPIGFGAMGAVYLAEQRGPNRQVAVKVLHGASFDAERESRFQREVEILGRLKHPSIARVHEASFRDEGAGGASWFSMDYIEGRTLREFAREQSLDDRAVVELALRVAEVVAYAHQAGVLHRDLKPENILIDARGEPHLLDFGVARLLGGDRLSGLQTMTGAVLGTVAYMSPEQARGSAVDERSEVFSLGAILYELLSGQLPFAGRGKSLTDLVRSLAEDQPPPLSERLPGVSRDLEAVVHAALSPEPAFRYPTVDEFREDLARWLGRRPVLARRPGLARQAASFVRRNRKLSWVASLVFLALSVGLLLALRGLSDSKRASESSRRAVADMVGFSRGYSIDELARRSHELWPPGPETLPALREVLRRAREVVASIPAAREHLEMLRSLQAAGELEVRYGGELDGRWVTEMQAELVTRMERLDEGLIAEVEWRIGFGESVVRQLEDSLDAWDEVAARLATSDSYGALDLTPQPGLLPLGPDPLSRREEFAVVLPGCAAPRRTASGELLMEADSSLVLVLLEGGAVTIGSQADDTEASRYDEQRLSHAWPVSARQLDPFFISKYEVTQHQWRALMGENPSYWSAGKEHESERITLQHPVESIAWTEAMEFCRRLGMTLPTEVQHEYAARGGTTAPTWWGGADPLDASRANFLMRRGELGRHRLHAPVGSYPPNGFGLHEVLGNVAELCLDDYKVAPWTEPFREADALVLADGGGERSVRGGSYDENRNVTLSYRSDLKEETRSRTVGFRPVRYLEGEGPEVGD